MHPDAHVSPHAPRRIGGRGSVAAPGKGRTGGVTGRAVVSACRRPGRMIPAPPGDGRAAPGRGEGRNRHRGRAVCAGITRGYSGADTSDIQRSTGAHA